MAMHFPTVISKHGFALTETRIFLKNCKKIFHEGDLDGDWNTQFLADKDSAMTVHASYYNRGIFMVLIKKRGHPPALFFFLPPSIFVPTSHLIGRDPAKIPQEISG